MFMLCRRTTGAGVGRGTRDRLVGCIVPAWKTFWVSSCKKIVWRSIRVCRAGGVTSRSHIGVEQKEITLVDDEKTHNVRIVMGEPTRTEEGEPARHAQA